MKVRTLALIDRNDVDLKHAYDAYTSNLDFEFPKIDEISNSKNSRANSICARACFCAVNINVNIRTI